MTRLICIAALFGVVLLPLWGQPVPDNRVLDLDGQGGFVALPTDACAGLEEATVDFWVLWRRLDGQVQRVINYGAALRDLSVAGTGQGMLWYVKAMSARVFHQTRIPGLLQTNHWYHIAATTGPAGMRLYLNGWLAGSHPNTESFKSLGTGGSFYLGQTVSSNDPPVRFNGQIDEVRIWSRQLDAENIARLPSLRGPITDAGFVARWSFDDGTARDSGPRSLHGEFKGAARTAFATPAISDGWLPPARVTVMLKDGSGALLKPVIVGLYQDEKPVQEVLLPLNGSFLVTNPRTDGPLRMMVLHPEFSTNVSEAKLSPGEESKFEFQAPGVKADDPKPGASPMAEERFANALARIAGRNPAALDEIGPAELVRLLNHMEKLHPALVDWLDTGNADLRRFSLFLLGQLGQPSLPMLEAIRRMSEHPDPITRGLAMVALTTLGVPDSLGWFYDKKLRTFAGLFAGLLLPFALIHGLLFLLHTRDRGNFYYALFMIAAAGLAWIVGARDRGFDLAMVAALGFLLLGLRFLYSLFYERLPAVFWFFLVPGLICIVMVTVHADTMNQFMTVNVPSGTAIASGLFTVIGWLLAVAAFSVAAVFEMARILLLATVRGKPGAWVIALGFLALMVGGILSPVLWGMLFAGKVSSSEFMAWSRFFPNAGFVGFAVCASIHLARNLAQTHNDLREAGRRVEEQNTLLAAAREQADRARELAEKASRWKSAFLANMSHELRTPLNAIIGYAELLKEEAPEIGAPGIVPDLDRIHSAAKHQLGLINDILDMSKIEAGKMTLFVEEFDVAKLVREVESTVLPLMAKHGNALAVECAPSLGRMTSDQTKMRQVLFNLLSNAAKFTEKGKITLRAWREEPGRLCFEVADSGIGMTEEQLGRLFQAFTQAEAATQAKYGGTGLGLAISRRFCQMMGGDIAVKSERGQGSVFTVTLPTECPEGQFKAREGTL